MPRFGKKRSYTDYLYTKPSIAVVGILCLLLSFAVFDRYTIERDMSARQIGAEQELQELQDRKEQLKDKVEYLEGERGIEEEIRKHFDVAKEGEQVVILIGEDERTGALDTAPEEETPWYIFWR